MWIPIGTCRQRAQVEARRACKRFCQPLRPMDVSDARSQRRSMLAHDLSILLLWLVALGLIAGG